MNLIYKIIFDTTTQTFKVVSELARSSGKKSNKKIIASVVLASTLAAGQAMASIQTGGVDRDPSKHTTTSTGTTKKDTIVSEGPGGPDGGFNTAIGWDAIADGGGATAIGRSVRINGNQATGVGYRVTVNGGGATAIGSTAVVNDSSVAMGYNAQGLGSQSIAIGRDSVAGAGSANGSSTQGQAIALGYGAKAENHHTIAIGAGVTTKSANSIVMGKDVHLNSTSDGAIFVGMGINWGGRPQDNFNLQDIVLIGKDHVMKNTEVAQSVSIGNNIEIGGRGAVAIGSDDSKTNGNTPDNSGENDGYGWKATKALGHASVALGAHAQSMAKGSIAIGANSRSDSVESTAVGVGAITESREALAIGKDAYVNAQGIYGTALGYKAEAHVAGAVALGAGSVADRADNTAGYVPTGANASGITASTQTVAQRGVVSVGKTGEFTRQIINVAAGAEDTDAVNVAQLKALAEMALTIKGDLNEDTGANGSQQKMGSEFSILTGAAGVGFAGTNLQTKIEDNRLTIGFSENPEFVTVTAPTLKGNIISTVDGGTSVNVSDIATKADLAKAGKNVDVVADSTNNAGGALTISKKNDPVANKDTFTVSIDDAKLATSIIGNTAAKNALQSGLNLKYKDDAGTDQEVALSTGLNFTDTATIDATAEANGVVKFDVKAGSITADKIANNAITADKIANNAITSDKIANGAVTADKIDTDSVSGAVADNLATNTAAKNKVQQNLNLSYKANGTNTTITPSVSLETGLDFVDGVKTTATIEANGKVKYSLDDQTIATLNSIAPITYVTQNGDEVVRANDGKFYPKTAVNPDGSVKSAGENGGTAPVALTSDEEKALVANQGGEAKQMGNVASGLGLANTKAQTVTPITEADAKTAVAGTDGKSGLLTQTTGLDKVATVGDLQALAQAGLDFAGNDTQVVHRPLGTKLSIVGDGVSKDEADAFASASGNIAVVKNQGADTNELVIKLSKTLKNIDSIQQGTDGTKLELTDTGLQVTNKGDTTAKKVATTDDVKEAIKLAGNDNPLEYVKADGTKLALGTDGQYYPIGVDGKADMGQPAVPEAEVIVNQKGVAKQMGNIASGLGLDSTGGAVTEDKAKEALAGTDGNGGLLNEIDDAVLNKATTNRDLQAVAKAGLNFGGDTGAEIHKNLSEKLEIVGGVTDEANLSDGNIGVISKDGKLNVKLAKELKGLTSVETVDGQGNSTVQTAAGVTATDAAGNTSTLGSVGVTVSGADGKGSNLTKDGLVFTKADGSNGLTLNGDGTITGLQAATTADGAVTKGQMDNALKNIVDNSPNEFVTANGTKVVKGPDGKYYPAKADGTADTSKPEIQEGDVIVNQKGVAKQMGNIASGLGLGSTGGAVSLDRANEIIGGTNGQGGLLNENNDAVLNKATTNRDLQAIAKAGLNFGGDNGTETIHKNLSEKLEIVGGADATKLSDNNIGVNAVGGKLEVKLSKELKDLTSVETKDDQGNSTVQTATGVTTTDKDGNKTDLSSKGVTATDKDGNNTALGSTGVTVTGADGASSNLTKDGLSFTKADGSNGLTINANGTITGLQDATTADGAVTKGQLDKALAGVNPNDFVTSNGDKVVKGDDGKFYPANPDGTPNMGQAAIPEKDIVLNQKGEAKQQGNVASGLGLGSTGGAVTAEKAQEVIGGTNGQGGLINETNDTNLNKVTTNRDLQAAAKAGLNFGGDNSSETIHKNLSEKLEIVGGADKTKLSDNNIGVNAVNGKLEVKLSKELNGLTSVETVGEDGAKTVQNASGITITPANSGGSNNAGKTVSLTSQGLNNGGNKITNIAAGSISKNSTDAVTGGQLYSMSETMNNITEDLRAGIAGTAAMAMLDTPYKPGKSTVAVGTAYYKEQSAIAVGLSTRSDNGNWAVKGAVSFNTRSDTVLGAGVSYTW